MKIMKVMISIVVIMASFFFVSTAALAVETPIDSDLVSPESGSSYPQIEAYDEEKIIDDKNVLPEKAADGDIEGEELSPLSDGKFAKITDLYQHWEMNGYPDYVGFVFSTDGTGSNLTVLLVGDVDVAEKQIRGMLLSDAGLSFGRAEYSYNELIAVADEIADDNLAAGGKFYHVGIGWTEVNGEVSGFGPSGKEPRIIVGVDESVAAEQTEKLKQTYGDMVVIEVSDEPVLDVDRVPDESGLPWLLIPALAIVIGGLLFLLYRRQSSPAMQTNTGSVVTGSSNVSRKQVIEAVKDSEVEPSEDVLKSILHKIDEDND